VIPNSVWRIMTRDIVLCTVLILGGLAIIATGFPYTFFLTGNFYSFPVIDAISTGGGLLLIGFGLYVCSKKSDLEVNSR
jgi:hypothetical protein